MWVPGTDWLLSVSLFAIAMAASPGPNKAIVVASGGQFGLRKSMPLILGISGGFSAMIVALAAGGAGLLRSETVMLILKWLGVAYVLWIAWRIAATPAQADVSTNMSDRARVPMSFWSAALLQWVNPKSWLTAASSLTLYARTSHSQQMVLMSLAIAILFFVIATASSIIWCQIGRFIYRDGAFAKQRQLNLAISGLLLLSLVPILIAEP